MSIHINLLPRPKRNMRSVPLLTILFGVLFLFGSVYILEEYQSLTASKAQTEVALAKVKGEREKWQKELMETNQLATDQPIVSRYINLPIEIRRASVDTTFLFDRMAALLPTNSVVTSIEYKVPDKLKVGIHFPTIEEAVAFIQAARTSPYFHVDYVGSVGEKKKEATSSLDISQLEKSSPVYILSFELSILTNQE